MKAAHFFPFKQFFSQAEAAALCAASEEGGVLFKAMDAAYASWRTVRPCNLAHPACTPTCNQSATMCIQQSCASRLQPCAPSLQPYVPSLQPCAPLGLRCDGTARHAPHTHRTHRTHTASAPHRTYTAPTPGVEAHGPTAQAMEAEEDEDEDEDEDDNGLAEEGEGGEEEEGEEESDDESEDDFAWAEHVPWKGEE